MIFYLNTIYRAVEFLHLRVLILKKLWNPCPTLWKEESKSKTTCSKSEKVEIEEEETVCSRKLNLLQSHNAKRWITIHQLYIYIIYKDVSFEPKIVFIHSQTLFHYYLFLYIEVLYYHRTKTKIPHQCYPIHTK